MRTIAALALIAAISLAATLLHSSEASCDDCYSTVCYTSAACASGCSCIQPEGPGTRGWCN